MFIRIIPGGTGTAPPTDPRSVASRTLLRDEPPATRQVGDLALIRSLDEHRAAHPWLSGAE
jgi:hypothetical protein